MAPRFLPADGKRQTRCHSGPSCGHHSQVSGQRRRVDRRAPASCAGRLTSASSSRRTALRALISTRRSSSQADPRRGDRPSPRPRLL